MDTHQAVLKLNEAGQAVFTSMSKGSCYPVPGGWGSKGWTLVELDNVEATLFKDALHAAWQTVAPKKLVEKFSDQPPSH